MNRNEELLRKQLELLAERSEDAVEDDLARLSSAMVDIYDRLERPSGPQKNYTCDQIEEGEKIPNIDFLPRYQGETNMENVERKALIAIRSSIRTVRDNMETLLTDSDLGHDIQDHELREMYYGLNDMAVRLTKKIEVLETSGVPEQAVNEDSDG